MSLDLAQFFFLSQQFGAILSFAKLSDDIEIIFSLENVVQFEQIYRISILDRLENIDFIVHELPAQLVLLL